jgi:hypothetical protein
MICQFQAPFSLILSGPSRSGKTSFIVNLIKNLDSLVGGEHKIERIIWCYKNVNSIPRELQGYDPFITFHKGIPEDLGEILTNSLLIFDDLMMEGFSKEITEIFTILSHHNNISIIIVMHNLFHKNQFTRNITLNAQYIVYFRNPRDLSSIGFLSRQLAPHNSKNLQAVFLEQTNRPYSYLIIDLCQNTPDLFKYRTNIFNEGNFFQCFATQTSIDNFLSGELGEDRE